MPFYNIRDYLETRQNARVNFWVHLTPDFKHRRWLQSFRLFYFSNIALKQAGADVNNLDKHGNTPLHTAVLKGNVEQVKILLAAGADVNFRNSKGKTPLMCVTETGLYMQLLALINVGADVNASDDDGWTNLMRAIETESLACVALRLYLGVGVNAFDDDDGWTRSNLRSTIETRSMGCAALLVNSGADVNASEDNGWTILMSAIGSGSNGCAALLVQAGADVNLQSPLDHISAIEVACQEEDVESLRMLIEAGADVKAFGFFALQRAAQNLNYKCMKILIEAGAEVNGDNSVMMDLAYAVGSREFSCTDAVKCSQLLFKSGVQINRKEFGHAHNALENALIELHHNRSRKVSDTVAPVLFFAAGEKIHRKIEIENTRIL